MVSRSFRAWNGSRSVLRRVVKVVGLIVNSYEFR